jgi:hypothetical protein
MACHEDAYVDAFQKLCDAVKYFVNDDLDSWRPGGRECVNVNVYYPVVVLAGDLLDIQVKKGSLSLQSVQHIQYRRSVVSQAKSLDYQTDVVTEGYFPGYLELVEKEVLKTARRIKLRLGVIRGAIDRISRRARRLRSPRKIREGLEQG